MHGPTRASSGRRGQDWPQPWVMRRALPARLSSLHSMTSCVSMRNGRETAAARVIHEERQDELLYRAEHVEVVVAPDLVEDAVLLGGRCAD